MSDYDVHVTPLDPSSYNYDLGSFSRPLSSKSNEARIWFNRGLNWIYAFNHEEACICFEQAIAYDPTSAMGYWGIAYASGPNYNKEWGAFDEKDLKASWRKCHAISQRAKGCLSTVSAVENALVDAIQHRFPVGHVPDDLAAPNVAFANAMREVHSRFGDDLDVIALYADALMATAPKKLFEAATGKPILSSPVFEVKDTLERGLQLPGGMAHPGLLHLYIHLMERSATPEAALVAADALRDLIPDGGHLRHMPSHIDVLVGDYRRAIASNTAATVADDKFLAHRGGQNFYSFYRLHNYHSLIYAAMLAGQSRVALDATSRMEATITEELLRIESPPMANWMEFFCAVRVHVLIRFGMWDALKRLPLPHDQELYCVTTAMTHYGSAIAHAATGAVAAADEQRALFRTAAQRVPPTRLDFPNRIVDVLQVATAMLDGEIAYRRGDSYDEAFGRLRDAIAAEDALLYTEPWGWMVPARHAYGALALEQGRVEEAARAYAEDLGVADEALTRAHQHPNNVWALHGYHECLVRLGRRAEARMVEQQLKVAAATADVEVRSSCFCRVGERGVEGCCS
ncbi:hypothetical protein DIS24_g9092 [Lasiodiplodia hormozganensis]|uniref:TPR domain protein n=1 Tax=Lasiodiplodia hormozganensis TaxID=869390 RepID=A0AA40CL32_9PEZI|nr:hypothetical protein DIS24_g9092 [Lasiodiplodia hormozganensis]